MVITNEEIVMKYTVYQYHISEEAYDHLNNVGCSGDFEPYPELYIQRDVKFVGAKKFSAWMSEYYNAVCEIEAEDLEEVFHIGNVGGSIKLIADKIYSVSVGDIIHHHKTNTFHMVDDFGFTQLLSFMKEVA